MMTDEDVEVLDPPSTTGRRNTDMWFSLCCGALTTSSSAAMCCFVPLGDNNDVCCAFVHPLARSRLRLLRPDEQRNHCGDTSTTFIFDQPVTSLFVSRPPSGPTLCVVTGDLLYSLDAAQLKSHFNSIPQRAAKRPNIDSCVHYVRGKEAVTSLGIWGAPISAKEFPRLLSYCGLDSLSCAVESIAFDGCTTYTVCPGVNSFFLGDKNGSVFFSSIPKQLGVALIKLSTSDPVALTKLFTRNNKWYLLAIGRFGRVAVAQIHISPEKQCVVDTSFQFSLGTFLQGSLAVTRSGIILCPSTSGLVMIDSLCQCGSELTSSVFLRGRFHSVVSVEPENGVFAAIRVDGSVVKCDINASAAVSKSDSSFSSIMRRLGTAAEERQCLEDIVKCATTTLHACSTAANIRVAINKSNNSAPAVRGNDGCAQRDLTFCNPPYVLCTPAVCGDNGCAQLDLTFCNPSKDFVFLKGRWTLRTIVTQCGTVCASNSCIVELGTCSQLRMEPLPLRLTSCYPFSVHCVLICNLKTDTDEYARQRAITLIQRFYCGRNSPTKDPILLQINALAETLRKLPKSIEIEMTPRDCVFTAVDFLTECSMANAAVSKDASHTGSFALSMKGIDPSAIFGNLPPKKLVFSRCVSYLTASVPPPVFMFEFIRPKEGLIVSVELAGTGNKNRDKQLLDGMHASLALRLLLFRHAADNTKLAYTSFDWRGNQNRISVLLDDVRSSHLNPIDTLLDKARHGVTTPAFEAEVTEKITALNSKLHSIISLLDSQKPVCIEL